MSEFSNAFGMDLESFAQGMSISPVQTMVNAYENFTGGFKRGQEEWKNRLRQEWRDSMKLPRKKKKQRRKEILIEWEIACWTPFADYSF